MESVVEKNSVYEVIGNQHEKAYYIFSPRPRRLVVVATGVDAAKIAAAWFWRGMGKEVEIVEVKKLMDTHVVACNLKHAAPLQKAEEPVLYGPGVATNKPETTITIGIDVDAETKKLFADVKELEALRAKVADLEKESGRRLRALEEIRTQVVGLAGVVPTTVSGMVKQIVKQLHDVRAALMTAECELTKARRIAASKDCSASQAQAATELAENLAKKLEEVTHERESLHALKLRVREAAGLKVGDGVSLVGRVQELREAAEARVPGVVVHRDGEYVTFKFEHPTEVESQARTEPMMDGSVACLGLEFVKVKVRAPRLVPRTIVTALEFRCHETGGHVTFRCLNSGFTWTAYVSNNEKIKLYQAAFQSGTVLEEQRP